MILTVQTPRIHAHTSLSCEEETFDKMLWDILVAFAAWLVGSGRRHSGVLRPGNGGGGLQNRLQSNSNFVFSINLNLCDCVLGGA